MHGTEVAKIAAGGSALRSAYPGLSSLFRLNVVNLMEPTGAAAEEYGITTGGLNTGMDWFVTNGQVANVSVASTAELAGLRDAILRNPQLLVVGAAGNESQPLHRDAVYPASYGGANEQTGTQFITVAAYDGNLVRATSRTSAARTQICSRRVATFPSMLASLACPELHLQHRSSA